MDAEMRFHLEARATDLIRAGALPRRRGAARPARIRIDRETEGARPRESRAEASRRSCAATLRHALRMFVRDRGFTAAAVITLALGIGANTAIFSLMDGLILRRLPVRRGRRSCCSSWCRSDGGRPAAASHPRQSAHSTRRRTSSWASRAFLGQFGFTSARRVDVPHVGQASSPAASTTRSVSRRSPAGCSRATTTAGRTAGGGRERRILGAAIRARSVVAGRTVLHERRAGEDRRRQPAWLRRRQCRPDRRPDDCRRGLAAGRAGNGGPARTWQLTGFACWRGRSRRSRQPRRRRRCSEVAPHRGGRRRAAVAGRPEESDHATRSWSSFQAAPAGPICARCT